MNAGYFIVLSNFAVCPTVFYFLFKQKWVHGLQIGLNAVFSCLHHLPSIGETPWEQKGWNDVFTFLDALYSYGSIFFFSMTFFLAMDFHRLFMECYCTASVLLFLITASFDTTIILSSTIGCALLTTFCHLSDLRSLDGWNPYLWTTLFMAVADITCFFIAIQTNYALFHSLHHLLAFTLPLSVECTISWVQVDLEGL